MIVRVHLLLEEVRVLASEGGLGTTPDVVQPSTGGSSPGHTSPSSLTACLFLLAPDGTLHLRLDLGENALHHFRRVARPALEQFLEVAL